MKPLALQQDLSWRWSKMQLWMWNWSSVFTVFSKGQSTHTCIYIQWSAACAAWQKKLSAEPCLFHRFPQETWLFNARNLPTSMSIHKWLILSIIEPNGIFQICLLFFSHKMRRAQKVSLQERGVYRQQQGVWQRERLQGLVRWTHEGVRWDHCSFLLPFKYQFLHTHGSVCLPLSMLVQKQRCVHRRQRPLMRAITSQMEPHLIKAG